MRARTAAVVPFAAFALFLGGCKCCDSCKMHDDDHMMNGDAENVAYVNKTCPIGNENIDTYAKGVSYKGHKVGFCCDGCEGGWNEMSEDEKDAFIADAQAGKK